MKKQFICIAVLLSLLWGLAPSAVKAQNSISYTATSAVVTFNLANFNFAASEVNKILDISGKSFLKIAMDDDEYGIVADEGYPAIPQLPLLINIPPNAKNVSVSMRNAVTLDRQISDVYIEPFVNIGKDGTVEGTAFNENYYNTATTPYISSFYAAEEPFFLMDEQVLDLTILPFQYVPTTGKLTLLQSAEFVITWTLEGSVAKSPISQARANFFEDIFMSYTGNAPKSGKKGKLLIITAPQYEQGLTLFKQYKDNIGIDTRIVSTTTTGTGGEQIADYIKSSSFKPDFVLLVGSVSTIPAMSVPITDYGYRNFKDKATKYGDVFLGRWPVASKTELANVINKTIVMEYKLFITERRVALLAGHGDIVSYKRGNKEAIKGFEKHNYNCEKYEEVTINDITTLQNNYPTWMIYSGIGCKSDCSWNYFNDNCNRSIKKSFFLKNDIFPLVFSFAGFDGNYSNANSMAMGVVGNRGPVSYFGPSDQTLGTYDEIIESKILGKSLGQNYIGAIATKGMTRFAHYFWQRSEKNNRIFHLRTYNLMGDPSLNRLGYGTQSTYNFDETFTAVGGINLTFNSTDAINIHQGLRMESGAKLAFKPANTLLLKGSIATAKGRLTGESKKITLDGGARISTGSVVELTANEFDFKPGFTIESGSDVTFKIK